MQQVPASRLPPAALPLLFAGCRRSAPSGDLSRRSRDPHQRRHAPLGPPPGLRLHGRRDARPRRAEEGLDPLRAGLVARTPHAPLARLDLHRARAGGPRPPRQPRLPPQAGRADARRAAEEGGLRDGRRRLVLRPQGRVSGISRGFDFYDDDVEPAEGKAALGRVQRAGAETEARLEAWLETRPSPESSSRSSTSTSRTRRTSRPSPSRPATPSAPYDGEIAAADAIVGTLRRFPEGARPLRRFAHRLSLGPRRGARGARRVRARDVPLPRDAPGSAPREAPRRPEGQARPSRRLRRSATSSRPSPRRSTSRASRLPPAPSSLLDLAPARRPAAAHPLRDVLPADPLRLERAVVPLRRPLALHRGAEARDLRRHGGPERDGRTDSPKSRMRSARSAEMREAAARVRVRGRSRSRGAQEARVARLPERGPVVRNGRLARRPEGPHQDIRGAPHGSRRPHAGERRRRPTRSFRSCSRKTRGCSTSGTWTRRPCSSWGAPRRRSQALKKTVDLAPEAARAPYVTEVANLCLQLGKWDEAARHARGPPALSATPRPTTSRRGRRSGRETTPTAQTAARRAFDHGTGKAKVRGALVLGRLAVQRNDLAEAQRWSDAAAALSAGDKLVQSGLHMLRGDVLARQGRARRGREGVPRGDPALPRPPGRARLPVRSVRFRRPARGRPPCRHPARHAPAHAGGVPPRHAHVPRDRGREGRRAAPEGGAPALPERRAFLIPGTLALTSSSAGASRSR